MNNPKQDVKVIKASYVLQAKVGSGPVDARKVKESQNIIDTNQVDFAPLAEEYITDLNNIMAQAKEDHMDATTMRERMTQPVMQLKANASMFKYELLGVLASIMLTFLEALEEIEPDAMEIVEAYHRTLKVIIAQKLKGDGGEIGQQLQDELRNACRRYFEKRGIPIPPIFVKPS